MTVSAEWRGGGRPQPSFQGSGPLSPGGRLPGRDRRPSPVCSRAPWKCLLCPAHPSVPHKPPLPPVARDPLDLGMSTADGKHWHARGEAIICRHGKAGHCSPWPCVMPARPTGPRLPQQLCTMPAPRAQEVSPIALGQPVPWGRQECWGLQKGQLGCPTHRRT